MKALRRTITWVVALTALALLHVWADQQLARNLALKWTDARYVPLTEEQLIAAIRRQAPGLQKTDEYLRKLVRPSQGIPRPVEQLPADAKPLDPQLSRALRAVGNSEHRRRLAFYEQQQARIRGAMWLGFAMAYGTLVWLMIAHLIRHTHRKAQAWARERALKRSAAAFFQAQRLFSMGLLSQAEVDRKKAELRRTIEQAGFGDKTSGHTQD